MVEDTAWHPITTKEIENWGPVQKALFKTFLGSPLKLWASVGHWLTWHFDLNKFKPKERPRVSTAAMHHPFSTYHAWLPCLVWDVTASFTIV